MKKMIPLLSLATVALVMGPASPGTAQSVGDDGIAASPRFRQILNERQTEAACTCMEAASFADAGYKAVGDDGIAASPKMRAMLLNERPIAVGGVGNGIEVVS